MFEAKLETIYFSFGDDWKFPVPPSEYLLDSLQWIGIEGYCILGL
jgi:hypothetical protein